MTSQQWYYHYTSTAGASAIRKDQVIRSKIGVRLSTLKPEDHTRDDILRSIYGNTIPADRKNRADYVVYVSASILDTSKMVEITSNLYQYSEEIIVSADYIIDKPACISQGSSWGSQAQGSSSGWSGSNGSQNSPQSMYYYTNQTIAQSVASSRKISYNSIIYLTTMQPVDYFRDEILRIIYGKSYDRSQYASFADWCIKIDGSKLDRSKLKQIQNKVYEYTDSIRVDPSDVMDKPKCNRAQR